MKKTKKEKTQERILETAADIFIKEGYAASRTSEIATVSEVSEATVFKYFKSKQGLLDAVVSKFVENMNKKIVIDPLYRIFEEQKDASPEVMFKALFANRIELLHGFNRYAIVTLMESRFNAHIRETIKTQIFPEIMALAENIVGHYKETGIFREDVDAWVLMRTMMAGVVAMLVTTELLGVESKGGSMDSELEMIMSITLRGAMTQDGLQNLRGESDE